MNNNNLNVSRFYTNGINSVVLLCWPPWPLDVAKSTTVLL